MPGSHWDNRNWLVNQTDKILAPWDLHIISKIIRLFKETANKETMCAFY